MNTYHIQQYAYIAGFKVPIVSSVIGSQINSLSSLRLTVDYSPHILALQKYTKIQVFQQIDNESPTLEFDGVLVAVSRSKNLMGNVSVTLDCMTDGFIWNVRLQQDFYVQEMAATVVGGQGAVTFERIDGTIDNFFGNIVMNNGYDIATAGVSILTSFFYSNHVGSKSSPIYYEFIYNGKLFKSEPPGNPEGSLHDINPPYYNTFLTNYKLRNKVYGTTTSSFIKEFFKEEEFLTLIGQNAQDLHGTQTFWQIASSTWNLGYHEVFDIPNPTFIPKDARASKDIVDFKKIDKKSDTSKSITSKTNKQFDGLAQYIIKPKTIFNIPLKCNIIWPNQILEENVYTNFLAEPTRVRYVRDSMRNFGGSADGALGILGKIHIGPAFATKQGYLDSFVAKKTNQRDKEETGELRNSDEFSDYEKAFGLLSHELQIETAYDSALFADVDTSKENQDVETFKSKMNKFLNYEFAQKYYGSRKYSIMTTSDVDIVPGVAVVVLSSTGQHLIAQCMGCQKSWSASGQAAVSIELAYPRWIYEQIDDLANEIDPLSVANGNDSPIDQLATLLGTERISIKDSSFYASTRNEIEIAINGLFEEYNLASDKKSFVKSFRRKVCTLDQYKNFIFEKDSFDDGVFPATLCVDDESNKLDSTKEQTNVSSNIYNYYDSFEKKLISKTKLKASQKVTEHLIYISKSANFIG